MAELREQLAIICFAPNLVICCPGKRLYPSEYAKIALDMLEGCALRIALGTREI